MASNPSSIFERSLAELTKKLSESVSVCINDFLSSSNDRRIQSAREAKDLADRMISLLSTSDVPSWLGELQVNLKIAEVNAIDPTNISNVSIGSMRKVIELERAMRQHNWDFSADRDPFFDFDALYDVCREECMIPQLFDEVIDWLHRIVASGQIDSARLSKSIEEMIATLKAAKNASYSSVLFTWDFLALWAKHASWEYLSKVPVIGTAVKSFQKAVEEGTPKIERMKAEVQRSLEAKMTAGQKSLDQPQVLLTGPLPEAEPGIIDAEFEPKRSVS